MKGKLYLVATPIGNLEDITIRALEILKKVDIIAAEDTRHTLGLLNHFNIKKKLISYYKENEKNKSKLIISHLLEGKNIAIVSDAGTPGISDPGEEIVKHAIENNIDIVPIPGACALINALICSGFTTREFCFIGFLTSRKKDRIEKLEELKKETKTIILYEAPHRIKNTILEIYEIFGDRKCMLARELTKIHEEFIRDNLSNLINIEEFRGEFVIVIEGNSISEKKRQLLEINQMSLEDHYKYYENDGLSKKDIIKQIAKDRKVNKNEIYQYFLDSKKVTSEND